MSDRKPMIDPWRKHLDAIAEHPEASTRRRMVDELCARRNLEAAERLLTWVDLMVQLDGETDSRVADLVSEHLMDHEPLGSSKSELLHQVIVRLHRAGGGAMLEEAKDDASPSC